MKGSMVTIAIVVLLFVAACAPAVTPSPPRPAATPGAIPAPARAEGTAWENVVQAAKKEGKLTIYSYSMVGEVGIAVSGAIKEKYGIPVDIITGRGSEMAARITTERRTGTLVADLMDANPTQLYHLREANATTSTAEIPVLREKGVWHVDPKVADEEGHILVHTLLNHTGYVNTRLVKAGDEPRSLRDLTQPKWGGKTVILDPTFSSGTYIFFQTLLRHQFTDVETVRAVGRNNVQFAVNARLAAQELAKGTYAIHTNGAEISYAPLIVQGAPIKAIAYEEGATASGNAIAAINNAPHPNAAKLFLNWLLSREGQIVFLKAQGLSSPRKDVPDFRPEAAQVKLYRLVALTAEDEKENAKAFREKFLVKLWKE